jgi:hypothetical protein
MCTKFCFDIMQDDASLFLFKARVQVRTTDWRKKKKSPGYRPNRPRNSYSVTEILDIAKGH